MHRARAFFYVCAGVFLPALPYHLGARSAEAQAPGNPIVSASPPIATHDAKVSEADEDTTEAVVFRGLRFGDSHATVTSKLKGFAERPTSHEYLRDFHGIVAGESGSVIAVFTPQTMRLWKVILILNTDRSSYYSTRRKWQAVGAMLTEKYGKPKRSYEHFEPPYYPGDGNEVLAFRLGQAVLWAGWQLDSLDVSCEVALDFNLSVTYQSKKYTAVKKAEDDANRK